MQHTSSDLALLAVSLREELGSLRPSAAARKIVRFCLADSQAALAADSFDGVAAVHARIRAAAQVVAALHYRDKPAFKEAAIDEVRKLLPNVFEDRCASQIVSETLKVFDSPTSGSLSSEIREELAYVMVRTLAYDGVTPTTVKMKVGLDLLVSPRFGATFPWKDEVEPYAEQMMKILRSRDREVLRVQTPALVTDRRTLTQFMPQAGEVFDERLVQEAWSWQPLVAEDIYEILGIECALVGGTVLTPHSDPAHALCELLESNVGRWKRESASDPKSAERLAREIAPLCGHITLLFSIFPELRSSRFETLIATERPSITTLMEKAMEGGASCHDFYPLCSSLKIPISIPLQQLIRGFKKFLHDSSPREVIYGLGAWWSFVQSGVGDSTLKDGTPAMQPFVDVLQDFVADKEVALARATEVAFTSINTVRASADAMTSEELSAHFSAYGEAYNMFCQSMAVLNGGPLDEAVLNWSTEAGASTDPSGEDIDSSETEEQKSGEDDATLAFVPVCPPTLSNVEQVRNALERALTDLETMSGWAGNQLKLPIAEELLPSEVSSARVLLGMLRHDSSKEPSEVRWAYAMQTLQLLATPEVQRLAQYGRVHLATIVHAMREVVARQRGFDEVADVISRFES
jgi:hypothetical protein